MRLALVTLVVPDYDAGLAFFVAGLGFSLVEDTPLSQTKRWVVVRPPGGGSDILLARAATPTQAARIGGQTGGRVAFFLHTDDFPRDRARIEAAGGRFLEAPRREDYGVVAQFADPFGNVWDLVEPG
ncbi:VOC family protein [Salinarimonas rosea]|uniref:VOC family protein n=1 Tax=Salinarimonas rosea TaxID=552063 RepID=UPI0004111D36|nr:VOC family protein [Salinarimonas rosea]